jgi:superfamily II DNA or RNA helicase
VTDFRPDEHQLRAVREMVRGSYMLVWDPGVGKTWPVVEAARRCGGSTLVIVPAHLRDQWLETCRSVDPWAEHPGRGRA